MCHIFMCNLYGLRSVCNRQKASYSYIFYVSCRYWDTFLYWKAMNQILSLPVDPSKWKRHKAAPLEGFTVRPLTVWHTQMHYMWSLPCLGLTHILRTSLLSWSSPMQSMIGTKNPLPCPVSVNAAKMIQAVPTHMD